DNNRLLNPVCAYIHKMRCIIHLVDKQASPALLPILRSQQQGEILALLLGDVDTELSLTEIAKRTNVAYPSVHREIERAEHAGLVTSHKIGNTRLVRANSASPYFTGLADILIKAFGAPALLSQVFARIDNIAGAYIYGSWAARFQGEPGDRPVADIDVLVLGSPDRDEIYASVSPIEAQLGRPVQITIRAADWVATGSGAFHDTVVQRPLVELDLTLGHTPTEDLSG
ncbi:MAG: hypothetical protein ACC652_12040, partial [Acidimicrobiales bacterium]